MYKKRTFTVVAATAMLAAGLASPAEAASYAWHSHPYSESFASNSSPLGVCITSVIYGKIRFYSRTVPGYNEIIVKKIELNNPTMYITSKTYCNQKGVARKLSSAKLNQTWYDYGCSSSYSWSIGTGWFLGVGGTRTCGKVERAGRTTSYSADASQYYQFNSGYPVTWNKSAVIDQKTGKICVRVDVNTTAWMSNVSDSFAKSFKPCVLGH